MTSDSESNTAKTITKAIQRVEYVQKDLIAIQEKDLGIMSKRQAWDVKSRMETMNKDLNATKSLLVELKDKMKNRDDALIRAIRGDDESSVDSLDSAYLEQKLNTCGLDGDTLKDEFAVAKRDMNAKSRSSNKPSKPECKDNSNSEDASAASDGSSLDSSVDSDFFRQEVTTCNLTEHSFKEELAALKDKSLTKANQPNHYRSSQTDEKSVDSDEEFATFTSCNITADTSRDLFEEVQTRMSARIKAKKDKKEKAKKDKKKKNERKI